MAYLSPFITETSFTPPNIPEGLHYWQVRAGDNAGNWSAWSDYRSLTIDTIAPTSQMVALPVLSVGSSLPIQWQGADTQPGSGVASYDVQYRIGPDGVWTDWLVGTIQTSANFGSGSPVELEKGKTYYFRVRATDLAGNVEDYPPGIEDTAWTTIANTSLYFPIYMR